MEQLFKILFGLALILVGTAFLYGGIRNTATALSLNLNGETTTAVIERVDVRETFSRKDDTPVFKYFYTEVVTFRTWDGLTATARLPEKNEEEIRGKPGDAIDIRYNPKNPSIAAPVKGSPLGVTGPILILAGTAILGFGAKWMVGLLL